MAECLSCGAAIDRRDAFCAKCGAVTQRGKGPFELVAPYIRNALDGFVNLATAGMEYLIAPDNRGRVLSIGAACLLLFLALSDNPISNGVASFFESDDSPALTDDGLPDFANYEDVFLGEEEEFVVTGMANVRDFPTSQGTTVLSTFAGGEVVFAREIRAFDPSSQWFKLISGGYVWGQNLGSKDGAVSNAAQTGFPSWAQGKWSTKDHCPRSNNGDIYIVIEEASFYVNGNGSRLVRKEQEDGTDIYFLRHIDNNKSDETIITIRPADDGRSLSIDHIVPHDVGSFYVYQDGLPCDQILRN